MKFITVVAGSLTALAIAGFAKKVIKHAEKDNLVSKIGDKIDGAARATAHVLYKARQKAEEVAAAASKAAEDITPPPASDEA